MTILIGGCRDPMPAHGPFEMIVTDPSYSGTSLAWDRRVNGRLADARDVAAKAKRAPERIAAVLLFHDGDAT